MELKKYKDMVRNSSNCAVIEAEFKKYKEVAETKQDVTETELQKYKIIESSEDITSFM